jgi:transposase
MEKLPRSRYSEEFKLQAVNMVIGERVGIPETARRLGLCSKTLANWVKRYRQSGEVGGGVQDQAAELSRLRREVAQLRMERDILKKAAAFFAKESR